MELPTKYKDNITCDEDYADCSRNLLKETLYSANTYVDTYQYSHLQLTLSCKKHTHTYDLYLSEGYLPRNDYSIWTNSEQQESFTLVDKLKIIIAA